MIGLISSLGKRVFLLRNVHENAPQLFQTRWAMNYLAGPMTRPQIPALNELAGATAVPAPPRGPKSGKTAGKAKPSPVSDGLPGTTTRPAVPDRFSEATLPVTLSLAEAARLAGVALPSGAEEQGFLYAPQLLARATIHYDNSKYGVRAEQELATLLPAEEARGNTRWEEFLLEGVDNRDLAAQPVRNARYLGLEAPLSDAGALRDLRADFESWIYRQASVPVKINKELGLYAGPEVSAEEFRQQCVDAAEDNQEEEVAKLEASYGRKADSLEAKLANEERELREDQQELARRKTNEYASYGETILSWFGGRRRSISSSLSKRDMRARAEDDVLESEETIAEIREDLVELHEELEAELQAIEEKWTAVALNIEEIPLSPYKKDIDTDFFGVAWLPHYLVQAANGWEQLPAGRPGLT